jgi:c-di-GMP-binding flagellar brake protein YcgR
MAEDYAERRQYERIDFVQAIFIEVVARGSRRESENTIIKCETVDISVAGLKVRVPEAIPQGSRLNIAVPLNDWKENLELEGEAMWVNPVEEGEGYWVGLRLADSSRENMEKWFRVVHSLSR